MNDLKEKALLIAITAIAIIVILFLVMLFIVATSRAELKTFRMDNGRNWTTNPANPSVEAPRFDFMFVNMSDTALVSQYKSYNPDLRIIQYILMATWLDNETAWDTLQSWCTQNGKDIEDMIVHLKYNCLYPVWEDACPGVTSPQLINGWDSLNDVGLDGTRDWTAVCTLSTRHGAEYIVDTFANWTTNEWVGYGLYNYYGNLVGNISGNSSDSIWWTFIGDTTNLQVNPGFEIGTFAGYDTFKSVSCGDTGGVFTIVTDTVHSGTYSAKIKHLCGTANQPTWLIAPILTPYTGTDYSIKFFYKTTDGLKIKILGYPGGVSLYDALADTLDGYWRHFSKTVHNITGDSILVYVGFQTSWGSFYNDSAWLDDFEIITRYGLLTTTEYYDTWYPYIIDDTNAIDHRASAMSRDRARLRAYAWCYTPPTRSKYTVNLSNPDWTTFWTTKWIPYMITTHANYNGFMVDNINDYVINLFGEMTVNEYPSAPTRDAIWKAEICSTFARGRDTCLNHNFILTSNALPIHDSAYGYNLNGVLDEGSFNPYRFHAINWAEWRDNNLTYGQNQFNEGWARFYDLDTLGTLQFTMEGYSSYIYGDSERTKMTALAHHYLVSGDSTYFQWGGGDDPDQWFEAMGINLGNPKDTCFAETTGTDGNGHTFLVVRRDFADGLVLLKPAKGTINTYVPDTTTTRVYLPSDTTYVRAMSDNSSNGSPEYIDLRYNEGAILIRINCD